MNKEGFFFCGSFLLLTSSWRARQNLFARQSALGGCTLAVRALATHGPKHLFRAESFFWGGLVEDRSS
jgi:hypothetical protein